MKFMFITVCWLSAPSSSRYRSFRWPLFFLSIFSLFDFPNRSFEKGRKWSFAGICDRTPDASRQKNHFKRFVTSITSFVTRLGNVFVLQNGQTNHFPLNLGRRRRENFWKSHRDVDASAFQLFPGWSENFKKKKKIRNSKISLLSLFFFTL